MDQQAVTTAEVTRRDRSVKTDAKHRTMERQTQCHIVLVPEAQDVNEHFSRRARFRRPLGRPGRGLKPGPTTAKDTGQSNPLKDTGQSNPLKDTGQSNPLKDTGQSNPLKDTGQSNPLKDELSEEDREKAPSGEKPDQRPHVINFPQNFKSADCEAETPLYGTETRLRRANSFVGCQLRHRTGDRTLTGPQPASGSQSNGFLQQSRSPVWEGAAPRPCPDDAGTAREALRRAVDERRSYHLTRSSRHAVRTYPELSVRSAARAIDFSSATAPRFADELIAGSAAICGGVVGGGFSKQPTASSETLDRSGPERQPTSQAAADPDVIPAAVGGQTVLTARTGPADRMPAQIVVYPDSAADRSRTHNPTTARPGYSPTRPSLVRTRSVNSYKPHHSHQYQRSDNSATYTNGSLYGAVPNTSALLREVEQLVGVIPGSISSTNVDRDVSEQTRQNGNDEPEPNAMEDTTKKGLTPRRKKVDTGDPGVSNTTQLLIQKQLRKMTFQFPEVSVAEKRKALGIPRDDGGGTLSQRFLRGSTDFNQRSHRTPRTSRQIRTELGRFSSTTESVPDSDGAGIQTASTARDCEQPAAASSSKSRHLELASCRLSDGSLTDNQTPRPAAGPVSPVVQTRNRYSKLMSLGLPNVKLDLDHNHFSRGSIRRRSQRLRQNMDPGTESVVGESSQAESVKSGGTGVTAKDLIIVNTGSTQDGAVQKSDQSRQTEDDPDQMWPGLKLDPNYATDSGSQALSQSMDLRSERQSSLMASPRRTRSSGGFGNGTNGSRQEAVISYSYYQLQPPPGPSNGTGQAIEVIRANHSLTPRYRYVHNTNT